MPILPLLFCAVVHVCHYNLILKSSRYKDHLSRFLQNSLFHRDKRKFYSKLTDINSSNLQPPDMAELQSFWCGIFENKCKAKLRSSWLDELQVHLNSSRTFETDAPVLDVICFTEHECLKRLRNWAAPGPDGIQGFWIKQFPALHGSLLQNFKEMLNDGSTILSWLPVGRTLLIPKTVTPFWQKIIDQSLV